MGEERREDDEAALAALLADGDLDPAARDEMRRVWEALEGVAPVEGAPPAPPRMIVEDLAAGGAISRRLPRALAVLAAFFLGSAALLPVYNAAGPGVLYGGVVLFLALALLAIRVGALGSGLSPRRAWGMLGLGVAGFAAHAGWELATTPHDVPVAWYQLGCVAGMVVWSVPGAALTAWTFRGMRLPTALTGAVLGLGVGLSSAVVLHLACPHIDPLHLYLHHGGAVLLVAALGAVWAEGVQRRNLKAGAG